MTRAHQRWLQVRTMSDSRNERGGYAAVKPATVRRRHSTAPYNASRTKGLRQKRAREMGKDTLGSR